MYKSLSCLDYLSYYDIKEKFKVFKAIWLEYEVKPCTAQSYLYCRFGVYSLKPSHPVWDRPHSSRRDHWGDFPRCPKAFVLMGLSVEKLSSKYNISPITVRWRLRAIGVTMADFKQVRFSRLQSRNKVDRIQDVMGFAIDLTAIRVITPVSNDGYYDIILLGSPNIRMKDSSYSRDKLAALWARFYKRTK